MAMYIYANLPESYGSFYQIQQDNYPFNRIFHKYIQQLVHIGIEKDLDIFSLIGYVEHGLSGEGRLPDPPEGDRSINFRFSIEDEQVEDYYKKQDLSNKMITQMIVRMTIRLADEYGTSLSRIATMIAGIDGQEQTPAPPTETNTHKIRPAIRITEQQKTKEKPNPSRMPTKKAKKKGVDKEEALEAERQASAESERLKRKLEELQQKQEKMKVEEEEDQVVKTNPHLADFFG